MIHAINFATSGDGGTKDLVERRNWQNERLSEYKSVGEIISYTPGYIPAVFKSIYKPILSAKRGAGYWWWKSWIILDALHHVPANDFVFYVDADIAVNADPIEFVKEADSNGRGIAVIDNALPSYRFTKRDCFIMMLADTEEYHNASQSWAAVLAFKKIDFVVSFVTDWLVCCCNAHLIDDSPSVMGTELPGYQQHRWDQAILNILLKKANIPMLPNSRADVFAHPPW